MKIFKSLVLLISSDISAKLVNLLTLPIYLFYFQPNIYGTYVLITVVIVIANTFTNFMNQSELRFGQEEWLKHKSFNKSITTSLIIQFSFVTLISMILIYFSDIFYNYIKIETSSVLYLTIGILYLNIFASKSTFLNVLNKYGIISSLVIVDTFFRLTLILVLITSTFEATIFLLLSFYLLTYFVKSLIVCISLFKTTNRLNFDFDKTWFTNQCKFSYPLMFEALTNKLLLNIDLLIINNLLSIESVGIYAIAKRMISYLNILLEKLAYIYRPNFFSFIIKDKEVALVSIIKKVAPEISFFIVLFYNAILLASFSFHNFIPESYILSIVPFQILMAKYAFVPILNFVTAFFEAYKKTKTIFFISSSSLLINVILDFLLIPVYGISGAAIASIVAIYFSIFIRLFLINKMFNVNFTPYLKFYLFFLIIYALILIDINFYALVVLNIILILLTAKLMQIKGYFTLAHINLYEKIGVPNQILKVFKKIL